VRTALAGATEVETAQRKTPKGGQTERTHREENGIRHVPSKPSKAGDVKNDTAGL